MMCRSLFALLVMAGPVFLAAQAAAVRVVVLNHVKVLDLAGGPARNDMAVVIRGSRIAAVTPATSAPVPAGAQVLDLSGKVVLPGLADMHHHLGTGASMPGPPSPGQDVTRDGPRNLAQMLAWGFTTIFSTSHANADLQEFVILRRQANEDTAPMPRFYGVGRAISVAGGHASQPRFASYLPTSADEARANVRALHAAGVDAI
jgi:imidazolonepropionase-like amidohydrolase